MDAISTTFSKENENTDSKSEWRGRYGAKHRPIRVTDLPGVALPQKVRIYARDQHFLLQWWEPASKKTISQRIDGDLLEAVVQGRGIESRLVNYRSSGHGNPRLSHSDLVSAFLEDLECRADAGEIDPGTTTRYRALLQQHYLAFVGRADVAHKYPHVTNINRSFRLEFSQFLQSRQISPNGNGNAAHRLMRGQRYVLDVVRSMLEWAADTSRGNLLPNGFQNPFRHSNSNDGQRVVHGMSEPDITSAMAAEFLSKCDAYQLPIFGTIALYGLRPDELGWIFWEDIHDGWLRVVNHADLSYMTKGRRDKQFPILPCLSTTWSARNKMGQGLLFHRRMPSARCDPNRSKTALIAEFQGLKSDQPQHSASRVRALRSVVLSNSDQLQYDHVRAEFGKLAKQLAWPLGATLKDFRHLFATNLENAGVPESYRRFLMGHAPGRASIVTYTHLNKVLDHYMRAVTNEFAPLAEAITRRTIELGLVDARGTRITCE